MALTPVEEGQVRDILTYYSGLLDLGADSAAIEAALGYGDVRVIDLPDASELNAADVMYIAQTGSDVKATAQQFGQFVFDNFVAATSTTITTTGGTVTLTTPEASANIIIVNGVLASNSTIVFPAIFGRTWRVINATTGAFTMVAKGPTGQSLNLSQDKTNTVFHDGNQLVFPDWDTNLDSPAFRGNPTAPTPLATDDDTSIATTAFAKHMDSPAFIGTPSVPTAPTITNTTQTASTAFVQNVVAAASANSLPQYVNSNITAGSNGDYRVDTRSGAVTITLPDPPVGKNIVTFHDAFGMFSINNLIINPQTKTILGVAGNLNENISGHVLGMWYDTVAATWKLT